MSAETPRELNERERQEMYFPRHQPRIVRVEIAGPATVRLAFDDGADGMADFSVAIGQGGVMQPLADPAFFAQLRIANGGRSLEWPGEIDFCADSLWLEITGKAHPLTAPEK